jgi:nitrate reductase alpha subunit
MPPVAVVERDYPNLYKRFTALGPLMDKLGNGGKGIGWNTEHEVENCYVSSTASSEEGPTKGMPRIETDIDAAEVILMLAPETNGEVAVKAWAALSQATGPDHTHLALPKEDEKIRFRDIVAQPRKIISSPTWSGLESEQGLLQRRLYQRPRADPVAHAHRTAAALSGSQVDARLRRGALRLSSANR